MIYDLLLILVLLQIKHWYIDFVNQTMEEVNGKGIYGNRLGIWHSAKQGIGTVFCILFVTGFPFFSVVLGILDAIVHYHVDWAKMNWGNRDIKTPQFWTHLGLDQMIHQLTYIGIVYLVI